MHPFTDLPDWPASVLIEAQRGQHAGDSAPVATAADLAPPSAAALLTLLRTMPPPPDDTTRDQWVASGLAVSGCLRGLADAGRLTPDDDDAIRDAWAEWCARWPAEPLEADELRSKFDGDFSFRDRDLSGWRQVLDIADRCGADTSRERHDTVIAEFATVPLPRYVHPRLRLLTPADCRNAPARDYVVKGLIAPRNVGCLFGQPGAGKSIIGPHIGYAVAQGRVVFGRRTKRGTVLYVAAEDADGMQSRIAGLSLTHGDAPDFLTVPNAGSLFEESERKPLRDVVAALDPVLIIIDTLAMAFPGLRENESEDMGRVVAVAREFTEHGAAVVLVHHSPKDENNATPRGHSLFNGALDMSLHLVKADDNGVVVGSLVKNRNGPCVGGFAFKIDPVTIGRDVDGDMVTTPVAHEVDATTLPRKARDMARSARFAREVLRELIDASDDGRVTDNVWRDACRHDDRVSAARTPHGRANSVREACNSLIADGLVIREGDHVRLATEFPPLADQGTEGTEGTEGTIRAVRASGKSGEQARQARCVYRHRASVPPDEAISEADLKAFGEDTGGDL